MHHLLVRRVTEPPRGSSDDYCTIVRVTCHYTFDLSFVWNCGEVVELSDIFGCIFCDSIILVHTEFSNTLPVRKRTFRKAEYDL
jgi:hypothetical protein